MIINGKEVTFRASVRNLRELAKLCKNGDINNANLLFEGATADTLDNSAKFVSILSGGVLDPEELLDMEVPEFMAIQNAAVSAFKGDQKGEIHVEPKKEKATEAEADAEAKA